MKPEFILNKNLRFIPKDPAALKAYVEKLRFKLGGAQDIGETVSLLGEIGSYLRSLNLFDQAEESISKALQLIALNEMGLRREIQNKIRLAHVFQDKKDFKQSSLIFREVVSSCRTDSDVAPLLHFALQHAGKNYFDQGQYQNALEYFEETLKLRTESSAPSDQIESTLSAISRVREVMDETPQTETNRKR